MKIVDDDQPEEGDRPMTTPREWPNNMAECRDQAAEWMQICLINTEKLMSKPLDTGTLLSLALIVSELSQGLRWLERAGAATTPKRL